LQATKARRIITWQARGASAACIAHQRIRHGGAPPLRAFCANDGDKNAPCTARRCLPVLEQTHMLACVGMASRRNAWRHWRAPCACYTAATYFRMNIDAAARQRRQAQCALRAGGALLIYLCRRGV